MAKLGGSKVQLTDIRTKFSLRPGGKVYDLSRGLDFCIIGKDDGSGGVTPTEIVTNTTVNGPVDKVASSSYRPIGFSFRGSGSISFTDNSKYPSYLKDEQTVLIFMRNDPTGSSDEKGGMITCPFPSFKTDAGNEAARYIEGTGPWASQSPSGGGGGYLTGSDTRDSRFFDKSLKNQFLSTISTIVTGSQNVHVSPFFIGGFYDSRIGGNKDIVSFASYRDVVYDPPVGGLLGLNGTNDVSVSIGSTGSIIMMPTDIVIASYDGSRDSTKSNTRRSSRASSYTMTPQTLNGQDLTGYSGIPYIFYLGPTTEFVVSPGAANRFIPNQFVDGKKDIYNANENINSQVMGNPVRLAPQVPKSTSMQQVNKSSNGFHSLAFRQVLSREGKSGGHLSLRIDGVNCLTPRFENQQEGTARFSDLDRSEFYEKYNRTDLKPELRAVGSIPSRMYLGYSHDYIMIAAWSRRLEDDEIDAITEAFNAGVCVDGYTSFTSLPLAVNHGEIITNFSQSFSDTGLDSSILNRGTTGRKFDSFTDSTSKSTSGSFEIVVPIQTQETALNRGYCFRANGSTSVGKPWHQWKYTESAPDDLISLQNAAALVIPTGLSSPIKEFPSKFLDFLFKKSDHNDADGASGKTSGFRSDPDGNIGTGFLYYSPESRCWVEKRLDGSTSRRSHKPRRPSEEVYLWVSGTSDARIDSSFSGSFNALEYRNTTSTSDTSRSTSFDVSGSSKILCQFAGSPNIGYLHPWKETHEVHGYGRIGYPTSIWGAPSDKKYHAYDDETIKVSDFVSRPFLLSKITLNLNIEASRTFFRLTGSVPSGTPIDHAHSSGNPGQWVRYVMNRRDIENYSFFLYRQRRRGGVLKDSDQDISSSDRFLIASASVSFYNSASFGASYKDGFWVTSSNHFWSTQNTNPLYSLIPEGTAFNRDIFRTIFTSASFNATSSFPILPGVTASLSRNTEPLHGPAYSHDWGVDFTYRGPLIHQASLSLEMKPAVAPEGFTVPTLMNFVSGVGPTTGKKWNLPITGVYVTGTLSHYRPIWNHTGYFNNDSVTNHQFDSDGAGNYAYQVVNYWHGSTRIPKVFTSSSVDQGSSPSNTVRNLVRYVGTNFETQNATDLTRGAVRQIPSAQFGKSIFDVTPSFSQFTNFDSNSSNRITPKIESTNILIDGRAINCPTINPARTSPSFSTLDRSGSDFYSIIQPGWWHGVAPVPKKIGPEIQETEYLLLPGDELVLGMESSNFATPDFGPLFLTGVYKDDTMLYGPTSYIRVLPGIGELKLEGRFLRDGESVNVQGNSFGEVSTVIGDVPYDQFVVTETDGYYGGIFDEIITGSTDLTSLPLRGVAGHATAGDIKGNFSINRFFTVYTERYVRDYFDDPIRNTLRTTGSLPGSTTSGYKIPQKAVLSSVHYGYLRDFLETPPNQVLAPRLKDTPFNDSTVNVKFIEKSSMQFNDVNEFQKSQTSPLSVQGTITTSQNVSRTAALDGPYKDGEFTDRDAIEYTVTV